jgi:hypothetical protein
MLKKIIEHVRFMYLEASNIQVYQSITFFDELFLFAKKASFPLRWLEIIEQGVGNALFVR